MFLQSCLPWQNLHPGKGKQGRNHPEKGLFGPYQELSTGHICPKSQRLWLRRVLGPLQPHEQCFVG